MTAVCVFMASTERKHHAQHNSSSAEEILGHVVDVIVPSERNLENQTKNAVGA